MFYEVADYLAALDAAESLAAEARDRHAKPIFGLVVVGAKAPDKNYMAAATHAVAFDAGGVDIQTMPAILPSTDDPATARAELARLHQGSDRQRRHGDRRPSAARVRPTMPIA
jgi:hypothetical protein